MASSGDLFELTVNYRDPDMKVFQNTYFYQLSLIAALDGPNVAHPMVTAFIADVLPVLRAGMPTAYTVTGVRSRCLFRPADDYEQALSLAGTRGTPGTGGELLPSFTSVKITASTDNGLVRKGRKMFPGLFEADQIAGLLTVVGLPYWAALAAAYVAEVLVDASGDDLTFTPVVVKRVRTGTPGNYVYRLPETAVEAIFGNITNAVYSAVVTTQNSRKD